MKKITFVRVDDRLIHGEVVTAWVPTYNINHLIIVDDTVAKDPMQKRILTALAPKGVQVDPMDVETATKYLSKENNDAERILLLSKSPIYFEKLNDAGIELPEVNLGGMGIRGERKPFVKNVAASPNEITAIKQLMDNDVHVFYQLVPEQRVIEITDLVK